jgi:hypothetical protein
MEAPRTTVVWGLSLGISTYITTSMAGALTIDNAREMSDEPGHAGGPGSQGG